MSLGVAGARRRRGCGMSGSAVITGRRRRAGWAAGAPGGWTRGYLRTAALLDGLCAVIAGLLAFEVRFGSERYQQAEYLAFTAALPVVWLAAMALAGGYDSRFIGVGSDEFRQGAQRGGEPDRGRGDRLLRGEVRLRPRLCGDRAALRDRLRPRRPVPAAPAAAPAAQPRRMHAPGGGGRARPGGRRARRPSCAGAPTMACPWWARAWRAGPCWTRSRASRFTVAWAA